MSHKFGIHSLPVVSNTEPQSARVLQLDLNRVGARMLQRVADGFRTDSEGLVLNFRTKSARFSSDRQLECNPAVWSIVRRSDRPPDGMATCIGMAVESAGFALALVAISRSFGPYLRQFGITAVNGGAAPDQVARAISGSRLRAKTNGLCQISAPFMAESAPASRSTRAMRSRTTAAIRPIDGSGFFAAPESSWSSVIPDWAAACLK